MVATLILILAFYVRNLSASKMAKIIIGGDYVSIIKYPHVALLEIICEPGGSITFVCDASILTQDILLTAGHCLNDCGLGSYVSVATGTDRKDSIMKEDAQLFVVHEYFDRRTLENDIGVVKSNVPLRLGRRAKKVVLMSKPPRTSHAFVAGWGIIDENDNEDTNYLKGAAQRILSNKECDKHYWYRPAGTICAVSMMFEQNKLGYPSKGDSGSALMIKNYIQIGLVSYKLPYAENIVVYTNISHFYEWITWASKALYCYSKKTV